jgi:apolipoprotein N-acyltransferase
MHQAIWFGWLIGGALLITASIHVSSIPVAVWLALTFLLHASRTTPPFPGLLYVSFALYVAFVVGCRGIVPVPMPMYFAVVGVMAAVAVVPIVIDRLVSPDMGGWASTLIFPMAFVTAEFIGARLGPQGTHGSIAYTQYGNLPLMQLSAFTGILGITFLIAWFASIVTWTWDQHFVWDRTGPVVVGYAGLVAAILFLGAIRLVFAPSDKHTIRAAAISFPKELFKPGELTRIWEGRVESDERTAVAAKLAHLQDWFLDSTAREARSGARLVAWPETNLVVFKEDEPAFLKRARRVAADDHIHLAMGMGTVRPGAQRPLENKIVFIDPTGAIGFTYHKSRPVPGWEARIITPGDGRLPIVDTSDGRFAAAICFDIDFPDYVRPIGRGRTDLWIVPANDWEAIKRSHHEMAAFRAIENGTPMLRATSAGLSGAFDAWGRVLGVTDHFSGSRTMVAAIPLGGTPTVYARVGDVFAWLCVAGLAFAIVRSASRLM